MDGSIPEPIDAYDYVIDKLVKLGMSMSQELHDRTLAAETADDAVNLSRAFNQTTRGVRQNLALHARLKRDRKADERAEAATAEQRAAAQEQVRQQAVSRRFHEIRGALRPLIWTEYEKPEEYDFLNDELDAQIDWACKQDDFLDDPIDEAIMKVRHRLPIREDGSVDPEGLADYVRERREESDTDPYPTYVAPPPAPAPPATDAPDTDAPSPADTS